MFVVRYSLRVKLGSFIDESAKNGKLRHKSQGVLTGLKKAHDLLLVVKGMNSSLVKGER